MFVYCTIFLLVQSCCIYDPSKIGETASHFSSSWTPPPRAVLVYSPDCSVAIPNYPLDLSELLDLSLKNNPQTRETWDLARAAYFNVGAGESLFYPAVAGSETLEASSIHGAGRGGGVVGDLFGEGETINQLFSSGRGGNVSGDTQFVTSSLSLSYLLLDFGGRAAQIESAKQALYAANWSHNRALQTVLVAVFNAYYSYLNARGMLDAREADFKDAETTLEVVRAQFEAGVATILDLLQIQSNAVNAKLQMETAKGQVSTTHGQLATAVGWSADAQFEVTLLPLLAEPSERVTEDVSELVELAKVRRPDLSAAYSLFLEARAQVAAAISSSLPTLSLTGQAQRDDFFHNSNLNSSSQNASLVLNVPIFSGWLYENQIANAKETAKAAYETWKVQENAALLEVVTNYNAYLTSLETMTYSNEYLKYTQEAHQAAVEEYKEGVASVLDVLTAQTALSNARTQWVQARTQFYTSLAEIAYSVGTL